ncbi:MAG: hypothetical protein FH753_09950 [Firmicutes bacterium]|nr:hypothetical protein [Bacillota bacterium]
MKRTKFLALALVAAIMVMGAGYAYWSETITISNTVKTGELDFTFNDAAIVSVDEYMDYDATSTCGVNSDDNNQVDIVLEDMYPGAEATVKFDLENTGTMKAKLKNFAIPTAQENEYVHVTSVKLGDAELLTETINIADLDSTLEAQNITIEPDAEQYFEITFEIDPNADEDQVAENLGDNDDAIEFTLTADGLQYNDDEN